jgi:predicted ATPase
MVLPPRPPPGALLGRAAELAWLQATFASGERLITVVGPPGVGKSALARAYAAGGPDAPRVLDASGARSPAELSRRLAHALGLTAWRGSDVGADEALTRALDRAGRLLLVVDNFEPAVERAAQLPLRWLAAAPQARLLVTSRERLRVGDEAVLSLEPLRLAAERPGDEGDAVRLLLEGARRARPGFEPDERDRELLRAIAAAVEGLPLALELAAGRLRLLSPAQLLGRLDRQLDVLGQGRRDGGGRQRSLRAALEGSWALLGPCERATLAQCSALGASFSLEQAEASVDLSAFAAPPPVFDLLHALVEKSLLRADANAHGAEPRFALLACVREFAGERRQARDEGASAPAAARPREGTRRVASPPPRASWRRAPARPRRPTPDATGGKAPYLNPSAAGGAAPCLDASRGACRLVVAADGRWFQCGASEPVSLRKRRALRLLLRRLAEQRLASPGVALSLHDLLAAGWPGERTTHEAGNARVYNALTELRKLGLRGTLVSRDDGYLLDPSAFLRLAPEAADFALPAAAE